jgi:hypothetical protein
MAPMFVKVSTTRNLIVGGLFVGSLVISSIVGAQEPQSEPTTSGGTATVRRLSADQYRRSIEDIFGLGIRIPGRSEPEVRDDGLLAIGDSRASTTPSGLEQYDLKAREIASQVLSKDRRESLVPCALAVSVAYDESCARQFISKYGLLLFRRPLDTQESESVLGLIRLASEKSSDFYTGLQAGLARMLLSPAFLFRVETVDAATESSDEPRLDDYSIATRLSFLLWNAPPDSELLVAAERGELHEQAGLARQVDRMIAVPKFEQGVRAFFSDMFAFDKLEGMTKDPLIYAKFNAQLVRDAQEQTLRTIVDALVTQRKDYRDLFTTKTTFMTRDMGAVYRVQVENGAFGGWVPYTFGPNDPRAGILSLAAFLMQDPDDSHEGKTSPTVRGKLLRELFLCQKVPSPPGNVDFSKFQDPKNPLKTARERLSSHRDNPVCAGCHSITDPVGLSFENYDALGDYRTTENDAAIDASGTFEGKPYKNAIELEKIFHDSPSVANCAAERVYEYGTGQPVAPGERQWLKYLDGRFANQHYVFPELMRTVATSRAFQAVSTANVASNQPTLTSSIIN